ncbi:helix-turn-helix transcriptional regulator [Paenibacillus rhizovicinus]|uniref:Helix-turn-helix transcriptional regulator n=1 Tax=Paenibacillus rhizovicinus TaxID=2704463 RepID=A0A6C0P468_9BACL|nr:helix-turn-helix domain-containing protein [Paenibacillus rhizovicinus]QHW33056.1 helix-turn-helix transcriptional regulator [Paenibacillus rhizovicinus]
MIQILSVHFDHYIPHWRTQPEAIGYNVMVLVTEGKVRYQINGEDIVAEQGDFLYIPQSTHRCGENLPGSPHQKYTVLFTFEPGRNTGIPFLDQRRFLRFRLANFQYAQRRFERLYEEMRGSESFRSVICLGIAQELLGILSRELEKPEMTPIKMQYAQIVRHYVLEHYREPIEIEQLARLIHRSPNYTTALFKEVFGHPPIRYMHQLRVLEACNLLLNSDMTIAGISQYLGYYDSSYFFRIFKKYSAMTPAEFVARGRQSELNPIFS